MRVVARPYLRKTLPFSSFLCLRALNMILSPGGARGRIRFTSTVDSGHVFQYWFATLVPLDVKPSHLLAERRRKPAQSSLVGAGSFVVCRGGAELAPRVFPFRVYNRAGAGAALREQFWPYYATAASIAWQCWPPTR